MNSKDRQLEEATRVMTQFLGLNLSPPTVPQSSTLGNENEDQVDKEENLTLLALLRSKQDDQLKENASAAELLKKQAIRKLEEEKQRTEWIKSREKYAKFRDSLPIFKLKAQLIELVKKNQVVVVVGETGSGKTTQITQYLVDAGFGKDKKIGCTQPRRVAARDVAKRVAAEFGTALGDQVGYKVRFDQQCARDTVITYMTDGMLVMELSGEPNAEPYSVLMLDEAHERSIHTDVSIGLLKDILKRRKDLRVIISSATLDSGRFSDFFDKAPVLKIPGRVFPVEVVYSYKSDPDYFQAAISTVCRIHKTEATPGDILVFLTGEDEIENACEQLESNNPGLYPIPLYSALSWEEQQSVFKPVPAGYSRKVILATNMAETSLTIEGIVYVVDSGYAKRMHYNPKTGIDTLVVDKISKAQAIQRAGRVGRTQPGTVYRLYTKRDYDHGMIELPTPEIQRVNVETVVLLLASMGITDILRFKFMDAPPQETVLAALDHLMDLCAIEMLGASLTLTRVGREISSFPLDPTLAKVLIKSSELGCAEEVLTIVALLSTQSTSIFSRPKKKQKQADEAAAKFHQREGDHITLLRVYEDWLESNRSRTWCNEHFVKWRTIEEASDIRRELANHMKEKNLKIESCCYQYESVLKSICSGFFRKIAKRADRGHGYIMYGAANLMDRVFIHPSSSLFKSKPQWVLYHEVVKTKQTYMRQVVEIKPIWLFGESPTFFQKLCKVFSELSAIFR